MNAENKPAITATTHRPWELIDGSQPIESPKVTILPGDHKLEQRANPYGHDNADWLVLEGTMVGMTRGAWEQWRNGTLNKRGEPIDWGEFAIDIVENAPLPTATDHPAVK